MLDSPRSAVLLLALVAVGPLASTPAAQDGESPPVLFRHADLGRIELGAPFAQRQRLGVSIGGGAYHVRGWYTESLSGALARERQGGFERAV